ncbi:MAG: hypothetical protein Q4A92_07585 [Corynebacterium sp.]|nr:hypothetical protein [Corynebacterium sp.]
MPSVVLPNDFRIALVVLLLFAVPWIAPAVVNSAVPKHTVVADGRQEVRTGRGVAYFTVPVGFRRSLETNSDERRYERGSQRIAIRIVSGVRDPEVAAHRYVRDRIGNARIDAPLHNARYQGYRCSIQPAAGACTVMTHGHYLVAVTSTTTDQTQPIPVEEIIHDLRVEQE